MTRFYFTAVPTYVRPVAGDDDEGGDPDDQNTGGQDDKTLTITQKQLDDMIESRLKRDRASRKGQDRKELARLKELQSTLSLKEEEQSKMQEYIDELEQKTMSAEEIRAKEAKKAKEQWENDLKAANDRAASIEAKYINSRINTDLSIGAQQHGVLPNSTSVVMAFLKPLTEIEAVLDDDGQATGEERVVINFPDVDEEGNSKTTRMGVTDAYKRMRELTDTYGNLFDKNKSGGLGGASGTAPTGKSDGYRPGMNMDDYMKNRENIIKQG